VSRRHPILSRHPWRHRIVARIHGWRDHSVTFHSDHGLDGSVTVWVDCSCGWATERRTNTTHHALALVDERVTQGEDATSKPGQPFGSEVIDHG
jgi:hypothetical protein